MELSDFGSTGLGSAAGALASWAPVTLAVSSGKIERPPTEAASLRHQLLFDVGIEHVGKGSAVSAQSVSTAVKDLLDI